MGPHVPLGAPWHVPLGLHKSAACCDYQQSGELEPLQTNRSGHPRSSCVLEPDQKEPCAQCTYMLQGGGLEAPSLTTVSSDPNKSRKIVLIDRAYHLNMSLQTYWKEIFDACNLIKIGFCGTGGSGGGLAGQEEPGPQGGERAADAAPAHGPGGCQGHQHAGRSFHPRPGQKPQPAAAHWLREQGQSQGQVPKHNLGLP